MKLELLEKDLSEFSRETVQMFFNDASTAGYTINTQGIIRKNPITERKEDDTKI